MNPSTNVKDRRTYISKNSPFAALADFGLAAAPGVTPLSHRKKELKRQWLITLALGAVSASLYLLLFKYSDTLVHLAEMTRQGQKIDAIVPIAIAFVFSYAHGSFTGNFWKLLGIKPKNEKSRATATEDHE